MRKNFRYTLNYQLKNQKFKEEWDNLEVEFQIIKAMIDGRSEKHLTQKELSKLTGITQGDISKIENGNANPSIKTLDRLANALGKKLKISFE
ncbi:helix-turn-helix domain-containing protein [Eubacteriales bacterium KG127]